MRFGRIPRSAPRLPGITPVEHVGSGSGSEVFLYQRAGSEDRVAVKVYRPRRLSRASKQAFHDAATALAAISAHPSIVAIHDDGVVADGRPYLVMDYCSGPTLETVYKSEWISVSDALRIAIRLAGALETAHRVGIYYGLLKPSTIFLPEPSRPQISNFGIGRTVLPTREQRGSEDSILWSPPEALFAPPPADARTDVYSLAAATYTMLAGRAPFSLPGATNSRSDMMIRIQHFAVPPLGRPRVSKALEQIVSQGMSKLPEDRPSSALEFATALQHQQRELGLAVTPIELLDEQLATVLEVA